MLFMTQGKRRCSFAVVIEYFAREKGDGKMMRPEKNARSVHSSPGKMKRAAPRNATRRRPLVMWCQLEQICFELVA